MFVCSLFEFFFQSKKTFFGPPCTQRKCYFSLCEFYFFGHVNSTKVSDLKILFFQTFGDSFPCFSRAIKLCTYCMDLSEILNNILDPKKPNSLAWCLETNRTCLTTVKIVGNPENCRIKWASLLVLFVKNCIEVPPQALILSDHWCICIDRYWRGSQALAGKKLFGIVLIGLNTQPVFLGRLHRQRGIVEVLG